MEEFYKISMQNIDRTYQKILSQFLYTIHFLNKIILDIIFRRKKFFERKIFNSVVGVGVFLLSWNCPWREDIIVEPLVP